MSVFPSAWHCETLSGFKWFLLTYISCCFYLNLFLASELLSEWLINEVMKFTEKKVKQNRKLRIYMNCFVSRIMENIGLRCQMLTPNKTMKKLHTEKCIAWASTKKKQVNAKGLIMFLMYFWRNLQVQQSFTKSIQICFNLIQNVPQIVYWNSFIL